MTVVSTGVPLVTVKPLFRVTTSAPVVTVTLRAPAAAAGSMFSAAVAVVAELTVSVATVIPAPKLAVLLPCTQCVNCPVRFTDSFVCPCCPVFGLTVVSAGPLATVTWWFPTDVRSVAGMSVLIAVGPMNTTAGSGLLGAAVLLQFTDEHG